MNRENDEREIHLHKTCETPGAYAELEPARTCTRPRSCELFAAYMFTKELIIKRTFLSGWLIRPIMSLRGCLTLVAFQSLALRWHEGDR